MSEVSINDRKGLKQMKDIKSLNEFMKNFGEIEIVRGDTPLDIDYKCLQLCKDYLSGNWSQQTVDTIEVRRVTGGMINQLYYCGIKEPDHSESVPQEVAIRFYGKDPFEWCDPSKNVVISLIFSENKMGPKVYGMFESGQILKFYKHRPFSQSEHNNPKLVEDVMRKWARLHSLNVPIRRNPKWMFELMFKFYDEFKNFPLKQEMDEYKCQTLKNMDFKQEMDWIIGVIERAESPIVFAHNDYRSSNLMITEPNDELVICDFDLTTYGYRGHDFVRIMNEFGPNQSVYKLIERLPVEDSVFIQLLDIYVNECEIIYGKSYSKNPINCVKHILKEIKVFLLFYYIYGVIFLMRNQQKDGLPMSRKLCMESAQATLNNYFALKRILTQQNIL